MKMISTLDELKIETNEYAVLVDDTNHKAKSFPLWIPKLMPLVPNKGNATKSNIAINNNIFLNETKPQTPTTIPSKNFLTLPKYIQADFEFKVPDFTVEPKIKKGAKFLVEIMHGNIKDIYVTDKI